MTQQAPALRVPLQDGERARRALLDEGALRHDLKVRREGGEILFPMHDAMPRLGFPVATASFETHAPFCRDPSRLSARYPEAAPITNRFTHSTIG